MRGSRKKTRRCWKSWTKRERGQMPEIIKKRQQATTLLGGQNHNHLASAVSSGSLGAEGFMDGAACPWVLHLRDPVHACATSSGRSKDRGETTRMCASLPPVCSFRSACKLQRRRTVLNDTRRRGTLFWTPKREQALKVGRHGGMAAPATSPASSIVKRSAGHMIIGCGLLSHSANSTGAPAETDVLVCAFPACRDLSHWMCTESSVERCRQLEIAVPSCVGDRLGTRTLTSVSQPHPLIS
jgi:hypothetical protein